MRLKHKLKNTSSPVIWEQYPSLAPFQVGKSDLELRFYRTKFSRRVHIWTASLQNRPLGLKISPSKGSFQSCTGGIMPKGSEFLSFSKHPSLTLCHHWWSPPPYPAVHMGLFLPVLLTFVPGCDLTHYLPSSDCSVLNAALWKHWILRAMLPRAPGLEPVHWESDSPRAGS